ncbi:MAG: hypothetical protein ABR608_15985 [Pseudonocardiaceae bacterium]
MQIGPVDSPRLAPIAQIQIINYRNPTATVGIALVAALQEGVARRGELPDSLPEPPPIPYEYLMRLSSRIDAPVVQPADQLAIVAQLRESLEVEDDDGVRADLGALLGRLRSRSDVTFRAAGEIDAVLRQLDGTTSPTSAAPPSRSTAAPAPPPAASTVHPSWSPPTPPATSPPQYSQPQYSQWHGPPPPPTVQPVGSRSAQPAGQQLAIWGIVLGVLGLIIPFLGMGGIICASVAKSRKQPLADAALAISLIATVLGLLIWASAAGL